MSGEGVHLALYRHAFELLNNLHDWIVLLGVECDQRVLRTAMEIVDVSKEILQGFRAIVVRVEY